MDIKANLLDHLQHFPSAPFLFIGSGWSRRYMNTETWESLLGRFAALAKLDLGYYISKADGDIPRATSYLAKDFHDYWWKSPVYAESRTTHGNTARRCSSPLKLEIGKYLNGIAPSSSDSVLSAELAVFREATVDGVITTNWDRLLESIFPDYEVYIGQQQLLFSQPQSIAEIYKIHGCCTVPESLVLTAEDYGEFSARNPYLAAKLLAVFIEHPVIFMGYSLSDPNVYSILKSITACLDSENLQRLQKHMVFVEWKPKAEPQFSSTVLSIDGAPLPVTLIRTGDFLSIGEALASVRRCFPAKLLRRLKKHVYELVKSNDPEEQMQVINIEDETDDSKIQVVYGVGVATDLNHTEEDNDDADVTANLGELGYKRISIEQVMRDVVFDNARFDPEQMVQHTLPDLLINQRYAPVFKYLRTAGYIGKNTKDSSMLDLKLRRAMQVRQSTFQPSRTLVSDKRREEIARKVFGLQGLSRHYNVEQCAAYLPLLDANAVTANELGEFLKTHFDTLYFGTGRLALKKLTALYDLRRYGPSSL